MESIVKTTEMHTAGEPLRIIESGFGTIQGTTLLQKRKYCKENLDGKRKMLMAEPRGHRDMYGALLVQPDHPDADIAVLFLHNEGYSTMCGHACIALGRYAVDKGLGKTSGDEVLVNIQCPCGLVPCFVNSSSCVRFLSVPAFAYALDVDIHLNSTVDIAYGGAFYAFVTASAFHLDVYESPDTSFINCSKTIMNAFRTHGPQLQHFENDLAFLYGVIFTDGKDSSSLTRHVCIFGDNSVDRSPTGSGVTARLALMYAKGQIKVGEKRVFQSILGTEFTGNVKNVFDSTGFPRIQAEISGTAYYTGVCEFTVDPCDPFPEGFSVLARSVDDEATMLFEDFWCWQMSDAPEFSTLAGMKPYNGRLEYHSPESYIQRKVQVNHFLEKCDALLDRRPSQEIAKYLHLLRDRLVIFLEGFPYSAWVYCVSYLEGPQVDFERLVCEWMPHEEVADFENILSRFREFPRQAEELIALLRIGIDEGKTNHLMSMEPVDKQFSRLLDVKTTYECPLFAPFLNLPSGFSQETKTKLEYEAIELLKFSVLPAFRKLRVLIADEYTPACRKNLGASSLPDGVNLYQQLIKFHTTTSMSPQEVHNLGLQEVNRIENEMKEIIKEVGSNDTVEQFTQKLENDPQWYYDNPDDLVQGFRDILDQLINHNLHKIILNIPNLPLEVKPTPPAHRSSSAAFYMAGTPDGSRPGVFSVNTGIYDKQPKYEMRPLALHEGNPGHHLQASFLLENKTIPSFMRYMDDRRYFCSPSRFPFYTAYVEGWGLYSEQLGADLGMYKSPYTRFGHLSMEMYRACRLVVDTGIHAFGWSYDVGVHFMNTHTAMNIQNIKNEVRRYITWPGQACGYKVGERKLMDLRKYAEKSKSFDIKLFHDVVLQNPGPLDSLEKQIHEMFPV